MFILFVVLAVVALLVLLSCIRLFLRLRRLSWRDWGLIWTPGL